MFFINRMCVLCVNKKHLISVDQDLLENIKYLFPECAITNNQIPLHICKSCEVAIKSFLTFKKRCLKSYYYWKKYLKSLQNASNDKVYGTFNIETTSFDVNPPENNDENDADVYVDYMNDAYDEENETITNFAEDIVLNVANINRKRLLDHSTENSSIIDNGINNNENKNKKLRMDDKNQENITNFSDIRIETGNENTTINETIQIDADVTTISNTINNQSHVDVFSNEDILGKIVDFDEISTWYDQQAKPDDKKIEIETKTNKTIIIEDSEESHNEVICQICNKSVTNSIEHLQFHVKQSQEGCIVCGKRAKELKKHMRKHMGIFHTFNCTICDMKYMFNHSLNTHMLKTHLNRTPKPEPKKPDFREYDPDEDYKSLSERDEDEIVKKYILFPKDITFEDKKTWKRLMKNVRPDPIPDFTCQICKEHIKGDLKSVNAHVDLHLISKTECSECNYTGHKRYLILQHMKRMHIIVKDHYCCICETYYKTATDVTKHFRSAHCKSMMYHCAICQHASNSVHHMKVHVTVHLKQTNSCPECNMLINSNAYMKYHLQKSHKYKLCIYCDQVFDENSFEDHVQLHLTIKSCSVCGDELTEYELLEHEQSHYFKCFECKKDFRSQIDVDKHFYKTHYNNVFCQICDKSIAVLNMDQLYYHYVEHLHERNVKCIHCDISFDNLMKFHKHMVQHKSSLATRKTLICSCKRKFKCKATLNKHMLTHEDANNDTEQNNEVDEASDLQETNENDQDQ